MLTGRTVLKMVPPRLAERLLVKDMSEQLFVVGSQQMRARHHGCLLCVSAALLAQRRVNVPDRSLSVHTWTSIRPAFYDVILPMQHPAPALASRRSTFHHSQASGG